MNFLVDQVVTGQQVTGRHFRHCYIYEGQHCSCGGNYQGDQPGPIIRTLADIPTNRQEQK